jgi:hypothetical protein
VAERLSSEGATLANLNYSGFYWTLDLEQKTGLRLAYRAGHIAGAVVRTVAARRRANSPCTRTPAC